MDLAQAMDVLEDLVRDAVLYRARRCTAHATQLIAETAHDEYAQALVVLLRQAGAPPGPAPLSPGSSLPTG